MENATAERVIEVPPAPYSSRTEVAAPVQQPANLMQALATAAADPRMDVEKVERLFAMHKEMMDREAEAAFNDALARAQARVQPIVTNRRNDHTRSMYATLAAVNEQISPIYSAEGLAVSFDTYDKARHKDMDPLQSGWVRVIATVSHSGGHKRVYHLDGPLDDAGTEGKKNKTGIQAMGSTVSYLRRYLVLMIFNVATADDNDGNRGSASGKSLTEKEIADFCASIEAAATEPDLLRIFGKAWNAAENLKDKESQRLFVNARDLRRKALKGAR